MDVSEIRKHEHTFADAQIPEVRGHRPGEYLAVKVDLALQGGKYFNIGYLKNSPLLVNIKDFNVLSQRYPPEWFGQPQRGFLLCQQTKNSQYIILDGCVFRVHQ